MIMTVTELRQFITTDETDQALTARLSALELLIRSHTNNNFQIRSFRAVAVAISAGKQLVLSNAHRFKVGDTLQISESDLNDGLVTVAAVEGSTITVLEDLYDEGGILVTKVVYPADIKMGAVNMMQWDLTNREKVGIQSEAISRHSVTYFDMSASNSLLGFPKALTGFLTPYMKARFGKGLSV